LVLFPKSEPWKLTPKLEASQRRMNKAMRGPQGPWSDIMGGIGSKNPNLGKQKVPSEEAVYPSYEPDPVTRPPAKKKLGQNKQRLPRGENLRGIAPVPVPASVEKTVVTKPKTVIQQPKSKPIQQKVSYPEKPPKVKVVTAEKSVTQQEDAPRLAPSPPLQKSNKDKPRGKTDVVSQFMANLLGVRVTPGTGGSEEIKHAPLGVRTKSGVYTAYPSGSAQKKQKRKGGKSKMGGY